MSDTYCALIYKGLYIEKTNGDQSRASACCINHTHDVDSIDFTTDRVLQKQRELIKKGIKIPGCADCWQREEHGGWSIRKNVNFWMQEKGLLVDPERVELVRLDYNVDPICNARCIMCGPWYSSAWAQEEREHGSIVDIRPVRETRHNDMVFSADLSNLREIYFNGGEPLATQEHRRILEHIHNQRDIRGVDVSYNTNGSIRPDDTALSLWKRARSTLLNLSIDATDSAFHYIRYPLDWSVIDANAKWFQDQGLDIAISMTVGLHNILEIDAVREWATGLGITSFSVHPVNGQFAVENAPQKVKHHFLDFLNGRSDDWALEMISRIAGSMDREDDSWLKRLGILDSRRGLNWKTALTSLARIY